MKSQVCPAGKEKTRQSSDRWLQSAVRYLARFDRTAAQVERFLKSKGASLAQARQTVGRLLELRYLDECAYADRWIDTQLARKPMGRERLKTELLGKGISASIADAAIRRALNDTDEDSLARRALGLRRQRGGRLSPLQASSLLRQRGFDEDTVARMIGEQWEGEGPDS